MCGTEKSEDSVQKENLVEISERNGKIQVVSKLWGLYDWVDGW